MIDVLTRRVPGHHWVWILAQLFPRDTDLEPGGWLYDGALRRTSWRLGPLRVVVVRMPCKPGGAPR